MQIFILFAKISLLRVEWSGTKSKNRTETSIASIEIVLTSFSENFPFQLNKHSTYRVAMAKAHIYVFIYTLRTRKFPSQFTRFSTWDLSKKLHSLILRLKLCSTIVSMHEFLMHFFPAMLFFHGCFLPQYIACGWENCIENSSHPLNFIRLFSLHFSVLFLIDE